MDRHQGAGTDGIRNDYRAYRVDAVAGVLGKEAVYENISHRI